MTYSIDLHIVDLIGIIAAVFVLGMMAGWKWLPRPIDTKKEALIDQLFKENMELKMAKLNWGPGKDNGG